MIYILVCKLGEKKYSYGTAFVVNRHILTAAHIIKDCESIHVYNEKERFRCEVQRIDERLDIALLKSVNGIPSSSLKLSRDKSKDGQDIEICGTLEENAKLISKITKVASSNFICDSVYGGVCIDLSHTKGFSGSPIMNKDTKEVYGIITWSYDNKLSGGISNHMINEFIANYKKKSMGMQVKYIKPHEMVQYGFSGRVEGCFIYKLHESYNGKLKKYDCIKKINDRTVGVNDCSLERLCSYHKHDKVKVSYKPYQGNSSWGEEICVEENLMDYPEDWNMAYHFQTRFIKFL
tara:strand:- start:148 stop:1023 length:876 start_codon:yes stop_codon:yes gene_type:complete